MMNKQKSFEDKIRALIISHERSTSEKIKSVTVDKINKIGFDNPVEIIVNYTTT